VWQLGEELGRAPERLDVHPLVVAVEHRLELLEWHPLAEEAEAVGGDAEEAEVARVGAPGDEERDQLAPRHDRLGAASERVPKRRVGRGLGPGVGVALVDLDRGRQVAEQRGDASGHLGGVLAGQDADVHLQLDPVGDDVGLRPAVRDGGREGGAGGGMGLDGEPLRQAGEGVVDPPGVQECLGQVGVELEPPDVGLPDREDPDLGLGFGQSPDDPGCLHERVVGAEGLGAVAGVAVDDQAGPVHPLLGDDHGKLGGAGSRAHRHSPELRDHPGGAPEERDVLDQPFGSHPTARLLVGDGCIDEPTGRPALREEVPEGHRHRGGEVEHVDGASAPDLAVDELGTKGVPAPALGADRHHVGVGQVHQHRRVGPRRLDAGDQRDPAGGGLVALHVGPGPFQQRAEDIGVALLLTGGLGAVVHAGVGDQRPDELDGLALEGGRLVPRRRSQEQRPLQLMVGACQQPPPPLPLPPPPSSPPTTAPQVTTTPHSSHE
jgi:hypothetical protein